ncbi:hypothetical protein [Wohlfahrtiimonas larvae]|uniref:Uncharacterized protein n=1 Tax=Wohlfahrtiimonas larvae TaxID=1157986 RepID=A0ABP9MVJ7_9GAMM
MIFKKRLRYQYEWTDGKARSFLNKSKRDLNRDIKKLPLLGEVLEAQTPALTVDEERERRIKAHLDYDQHLRDGSARIWRKARAIYFTLPPDIKKRIMDRWNSRIYPLHDTNFAHIVDVESGNQARRLADIAEREQVIKSKESIQLTMFT